VFRTIDANCRAARPDRAGNLYRAVAKATADIENFGSLRIQIAPQHLVAMSGEPCNEQVLEAHELVIEDGIPGLDDNVIARHHSPLGRGTNILARKILALAGGRSIS